MVSKNHKNVCKVLNYTEHLLVLVSTVNGCVSISAFASLVGIPIGTASSEVGIKYCAVSTGIKKYLSIFKKKRKKRDSMILLANATEV